MTDPLSFLEKIRAVPFPFSRRFMPFTVWNTVTAGYLSLGMSTLLPENVSQPLVVTGFLLIGLTLWANATAKLPNEERWLRRVRKLLDGMCWEMVEEQLSAPPWLPSFATRIAHQELLIRLKTETGGHQVAYEMVLATEREVLLEKEQQSIQLAKASLLFRAGNYMAFREVLSRLATDKLEYRPHRFAYLQNKSRLCEFDGDYRLAKRSIEQALEISESTAQRAAAYNDLARLEDMTGIVTNAISYYEQAWILLQEEPVPRLFSIIVHNLLIKYAQTDEASKALALLDRYHDFVDLKNAEQLLQLLNDQTHLARQLGNRELLLDAYKRSEELQLRLGDSQRFALTVSELRMRLADEVDFPEYFARAFAQLPIQKLSIDERIKALDAFWVACKQGITILPDKQLDEALTQIIKEMESFEGVIDDRLRTIPHALPAQRDYWLGRKLEIVKLRIFRAGPAVPQIYVNQLFELMQGRVRIWADMGNAEQEIGALLVFCDEYVAYGNGLGTAFQNDYRDAAQSAIAQAEVLIEKEWPRPTAHQYSLGVAYFLWKIAANKDKATKWLVRFEGVNTSLRHNMGWLRRNYIELKKELGHIKGISQMEI